MKKLALIVFGVLVSCLLVLGEARQAVAFPERPLEIIVPFGVGGGGDTVSRALAEGVRPLLKVPVVITNMPGGGGTRGMLHVTGLPADGHTVLFVTTSHMIDAVKPRTRAHVLKDFEFLLRLQNDVVVLYVSADSRFKTLADLVEFGRKNPRFIRAGGTTPGGWSEIGAVAFFRKLGVEITFVPFESGAEVHAAILGGHIHTAWDEVAESMGLIRAGRFRPLVTIMEKRHPVFPDVPSSVELGIDFTHGQTRYLVVRRGTPPERMKFLHDTFRRAMDHKTYRKLVADGMLEVRPGYLGPAEAAKFAEGQVTFFTEVLRELGHVK